MAYGGAVASAYVAEIPSVLAHVVAAVATGALLRDLRRYAWLSSPRAIVGLRRRADGWWELSSRGGQVARARPRPRGYAHPWCVALVFRTRAGGSVRVPVVADMVERETFRVLRMTVRSGS